MTSIYKIRNIINGNIYIGKTVATIQHRWNDHIYSALNNDKDGNCPLHRAIRKYGKDAFQLELIEQCDDNLGSEREIYWIAYYDSYNNGYNATIGGDGNPIYNYNEILRLWNEGKTNKAICSILGCDKGVVTNALYSFNVDKSELLKRRSKSISKIDDNKVLELWDKEYTVIQISKELQVSDKY